uniref:Integrase core domain containing protein n=1 Tax=Solanum tuberosum TaxID=4113 RepID=M1DIP1_SOLTU
MFCTDRLASRESQVSMLLPKLGDDILKAWRHDDIAQGKFEYPLVCRFIDECTKLMFCFSGTMGPRRKNANKHAPVTASQLEGHDDSEASGFEVQINVTSEDHSPRATRSLARRAILQDSPPQAEEGGSSFDNGQTSGSKFDADAGSQSADGAGGSAESESSSQSDTSTSPLVATTETETGFVVLVPVSIIEDPNFGKSKGRPRKASRTVKPLMGRGSNRKSARLFSPSSIRTHF